MGQSGTNNIQPIQPLVPPQSPGYVIPIGAKQIIPLSPPPAGGNVGTPSSQSTGMVIPLFKPTGTIAPTFRVDFTTPTKTIQPVTPQTVPLTPDTGYFVSQSPGGMFGPTTTPTVISQNETDDQSQLILDPSLFVFNGQLPSGNPMMPLLVSSESLSRFMDQLPTSEAEFIPGNVTPSVPPVIGGGTSTIVPQSSGVEVMQIISRIDTTRLIPKGGYTADEIKSFLKQLGLPVKQGVKVNRDTLLQYINQRRIR